MINFIGKFSRYNLKRKIIITFNILNVLSFLCIFTVVMLSFKTYLNSHYEIITESNLKQASALIVNYMDRMENCAKSFHMDEKVKNIFEKYRTSSEDEFYAEYFDYIYIGDVIKRISTEYDFDISCYVNNSNFGYVSDDGIVKPLDMAYEFYKNRRVEPIFVINETQEQKEYLSYIEPIMSSNSFTDVAGFVQVNLSISEINKILKSINLYDETTAYIITENRSIILKGDKITFASLDFVKKEKNNNDLLQYNYDIPHTEWSIGILAPENMYIKMGKTLIISFVGILMILIIILYKLITIFTSSMTRRIDYITKSFENDFEVNFPVLANSNPHDDIGKLIHAYNKMIERIEHLSKSEEKLKIDYELRLRQEQINPHFLYNCLASISALIMTGKIEDALTSVKLLSDFYKKNLSNPKKMISIKQELDITNIYFEMQKFCTTKEIFLDIDIDEVIHNFAIPKMTLQPIVENAIIHGILPANDASDKNNILIVGYIEDDYIYLAVSDNGVGMSKDKLSQIQSDSANKRGIGLKNIDERIKLFYGDDCGLNIESELGEFTLVTLKIKMIDVDDKIL